MRLWPMTLTTDDYAKLASLVSSNMASAFTDPELLREMRHELRRAELVEPADLPEDVTAMNSMITIRDVRTQVPETYTLVFPPRADIANRRLSVLSRAGIAVLGVRVGDDIQWPAAAGARLMRVDKVVHPKQSRHSVTT